MAGFSVPASFQLLGRTISVEFDEGLTFREDCQGEARYREDKIKLQPAGGVRTQAAVEADFFHELMHWVFHVAEYKKLRSDEGLVNLVGGLLHQSLVTARNV